MKISLLLYLIFGLMALILLLPQAVGKGEDGVLQILEYTEYTLRIYSFLFVFFFFTGQVRTPTTLNMSHKVDATGDPTREQIWFLHLSYLWAQTPSPGLCWHCHLTIFKI